MKKHPACSSFVGRTFTALASLFLALFLAFLALLLGACAPTAPREDSVHFHTRITESGLKHFQVTVILPPEHRSQHTNPQQNTRFSIEERAARRAEKVLKYTAELKIQETQFCREGYWFLGNNYYGRKVHIRGECNDTATAADREKFPDTLLYW
jgi:hypothetical protein